MDKKDNVEKVYDIDSVRERFFGFIPRERATHWFMLGNAAYFAFCIFGFGKIPPVLVFGWWPAHDMVTKLFIANWAAIMWGVYYYKFWPLLDDGYDDLAREEDE